MTTFVELRERVIEEFDVTREQLESKNRDRTLVIARTALVNLCRDKTKLSYPQIANLMKKHPTTLVTAANRGNDLVRAMECYRAAMSWDA